MRYWHDDPCPNRLARERSPAVGVGFEPTVPSLQRRPSRPLPTTRTGWFYDLAVSYDIYFLSRCEGQSWDEVLEAMEDAAAEDSEPIPDELLEAWQRIEPQARTLLGDVDITEYEQESRDLSHSGTGINLSVFGDEVSVTVPYWHVGDGAATVLGTLFDLSAIVEKETGLTAYDPQVEMPLADTPPQQAMGIMSRITTDLRNRY